MKVAVVAHSGKSMGGGLLELRRELAARGVDDLIWSEVPKSRKAPAEVGRALDSGADLVFAWGGDGMVRRCAEVIAGTAATLAILPAGTANLLATNLGIPQEVSAAVEIGLHGRRRMLDVGRFNDERFVVMAGAGFDAAMIRGAGTGKLKEHYGRLAYIWSGATNLCLEPFRAKVAVDGVTWFKGSVSCILLGNVGALFGGIEVFEGARPDDGKLDVGVATADGLVEWGRVLARTAFGSVAKSPFVETTTAHAVDVELDRKVRYELDGGDRSRLKSFTAEVEPAALRVCVPDRRAPTRK